MLKKDRQIRISASRAKSLSHCSYLFYLKEVLGLPEKTHWKTLCGTAVHNIFEHIMRPKRKKMFFNILNSGFTFEEYPQIERYVNIFCAKHNVTLHTMQEFEDMIALAFKCVAKYFLDNPDVEFTNEERFQIQIGGATISGFIDLLIRLPGDEWVVIDLKTQGKRFTKKDLIDNVQALMYQLAIWKIYGKKSRVEFMMLRHPPTTRTPDKHIQSVPAYNEEQFLGFEVYVDWLYDIVQEFTEEEAKKNFCEDFGFCQYVCQFARPFEYQILVDSTTGDQIGSAFMDETLEAQEGQEVKTAHYKGCPKHIRS